MRSCCPLLNLPYLIHPRPRLPQVRQQSALVCVQVYTAPRFHEEDYLLDAKKCGRALTQPQMSVYAALYAWRDRLARQQDESLGYVLSRAAMTALAVAAPASVGGVMQCLGGRMPLVAARAQEARCRGGLSLGFASRAALAGLCAARVVKRETLMSKRWCVTLSPGCGYHLPSGRVRPSPRVPRKPRGAGAGRRAVVVVACGGGAGSASSGRRGGCGAGTAGIRREGGRRRAAAAEGGGAAGGGRGRAEASEAPAGDGAFAERLRSHTRRTGM